jgi:hypothetical protein
MSEHYQVGDALVAYKVMAEARKISRPQDIQISGKHKGYQVTLTDTVYCVITTPLKALHHKRSSSPHSSDRST